MCTHVKVIQELQNLCQSGQEGDKHSFTTCSRVSPGFKNSKRIDPNTAAYTSVRHGRTKKKTEEQRREEEEERAERTGWRERGREETDSQRERKRGIKRENEERGRGKEIEQHRPGGRQT